MYHATVHFPHRSNSLKYNRIWYYFRWQTVRNLFIIIPVPGNVSTDKTILIKQLWRNYTKLKHLLQQLLQLWEKAYYCN